MSDKVFPYALNFGGVSITLLEDGTWCGDKEAFLKVTAEAEGYAGDAPILMWLVVRALRSETSQPYGKTTLAKSS